LEKLCDQIGKCFGWANLVSKFGSVIKKEMERKGIFYGENIVKR